jgi:hypothetical protein
VQCTDRGDLEPAASASLRASSNGAAAGAPQLRAGAAASTTPHLRASAAYEEPANAQRQRLATAHATATSATPTYATPISAQERRQGGGDSTTANNNTYDMRAPGENRPAAAPSNDHTTRGTSAMDDVYEAPGNMSGGGGGGGRISRGPRRASGAYGFTEEEEV